MIHRENTPRIDFLLEVEVLPIFFQDCSNLIGGYVCTCAEGYTDDAGNCVDVNECDIPDTCHEDANCANTDGQ